MLLWLDEAKRCSPTHGLTAESTMYIARRHSRLAVVKQHGLLRVRHPCTMLAKLANRYDRSVNLRETASALD